MSDKLRVAVLFGGQSGEHEVSLLSAQAVMAALDPAKYEVVPIGITRDGRWLAGSAGAQGGPWRYLVALADRSKLPAGVEDLPDPVAGESAASSAVVTTEAALPRSLAEEIPSPHSVLPVRARTPSRMDSPQAAIHDIDVVFPVLHGPLGEDGTVQGLMELAGVPYVGCRVLASAVAMDKALMKAAFASAGLPVLPWMLVRRSDLHGNISSIVSQIEQTLRYPLFVKPANMGSSVGITKAANRQQLEQGLIEAASHDRRIVVEQGVSAREIEISVMGNERPQASVAGEVVPSGEWYDYAAKYLDGQSQILIPAPIDGELPQRVTELALRAFIALDCAGLARVDFLLDKDSGELWLNEVNTMPGFTNISMYAKMWAASGLPYAELLDRLIALALERHNRL